MAGRELESEDGTRWRVTAPSRPSPARLDVVFESLEEPATLFRGEAVAADLAELSDGELRFLLAELRSADVGPTDGTIA